MPKPRISIGITSIVGWLTGLGGLLPIAAKAVQEGSGIAVHGPEAWLALTGIGLMAITNMGRYLQNMAGIGAKVKVGISTVIGWSVGFAGLLPILSQSYSEGTQALHSPEKYAAIAGVISLATTHIGRYLQAFKLP